MTHEHDARGVTHFRDYVKDLPHKWIFDNLIGGGAGSRGILSSAMIKEAAAKFAAKTALVKRFKSLTPAMRVRCSQVYLTGEIGLSFSGACAKEPLLSSLLVFAARVGEGGGASVKLFGFEEFEHTLRPLMAQTLADAGASGDCSPHAAGCPWRPLNDVAAAASLAFHGALRRSAHGGLTRASLNALKKVTHDPTLSGKSVSDDGLPGHPAGLLIGYCVKEGILIDADHEYALCEQRFAAWSEKSMKERVVRLTNYAGEFIGGFNLELLRDMLIQGECRRMSVNCVVPEPDRPALTRALYVLEFLGSAHTSHSHNPDTVRFSAVQEFGGDIDRLHAKQSKTDTVIMPDFSVFLPQESTPSELFAFSKAGQLTAFDKVYKGQIAKSSISNSLSAGTDPAHIKEWLHSRCASVNVVKTIDEWMREFSRLFICADATLITSEERAAKTINALEPLRKYLEKVSAHTIYRIKPGCEHKVQDVLEKLGFDTRAPGSAGRVYRGDSQSKSAEKHKTDDASYVEHDENLYAASSAQGTRKPITDFTPPPAEERLPEMRGTKYGSRLKPLDISEMIQVIDYAILTNQAIKVDYAGSANVKAHTYTAVPINIDKGIDASVEVEIPGMRGRKQLYLNKINRIGVVAV